MPSPDPATPERPVAARISALWRAVLVAAALAALLLLAPLVPAPDSALQFRLLAYPSHLLFFLLLGVFCVCVAEYRNAPIKWLVAAAAGAFAALMLLNVLEVPVASDIAKITFGAIAGVAFARAIERPWWLVPICICVPLADAWSVFSERGVTNAVVDKAQENPTWIEWPTIATPIAGFPYELFGRIGIVDVLFLSLLLTVAVQWGMGTKRGVVAMALGFVATSALVFEGASLAIPALPLLCLAFLIVYAPALWRDLRAAAAGSPTPPAPPVG